MSATENKIVPHADMPVHVYSSEASISFFNSLRRIFAEFPMAHSLGYTFAQRNIKAKYRQSILGVLWALLPPLATAAIWILLNQSKIVTIGDTGGNYALFVVTGTMMWSVFSNAVSIPGQVVQANVAILVKINFPREALMITAFYEILFNAAIAFVIIIAEVIIFQIPVSLSTFFFIPALFVLIVLGMCFGLMILPLSVLYKDVQFALPTFLQLAMYLTPVVYATPVFAGATKILAFNPVSPILTFGRDCLLGVTSSVDLMIVGIISVAVIVILIIGLVMQRIALEILIERMGS